MENFNNNQQSFWQFSDQLRVQNTNFGNLSINDGIWGSSLTSKKNEERRNFDVRVGGERVSGGTQNLQPSKGTNFNGFNDGWKNESYNNSGNGNGVFHKGVYSKYGNNNNNINKKNKKEVEVEKKSNSNSNNNNSNNNKVVDKRFKTLPATEALPRNEVVGGYIFVCNNDTMEENLKRQLFDGQNFVFQAHKLSLFDVHLVIWSSSRSRDSVRAITPGLPLSSTTTPPTNFMEYLRLAASFGGTNMTHQHGDKKSVLGNHVFLLRCCNSDSLLIPRWTIAKSAFNSVLCRFAVRVATRKFAAIRGGLFQAYSSPLRWPQVLRLELSVPEALALLDIFADTNPLKDLDE
ncbi:hypothetical protein IFM89_034262 [Coptis chinensis]|uniref:DCD domain-containing protein n=1 Tax=Coptis chinensis TaxID=261450 RepID=A0A835LH80_9MAGN|nr:hypothetical protein IFM89_034262 [Coptis chinensis]